MRKQFRERLAKEYRYAATKMQEARQTPRKLFYFSVLFGEGQRVLNWEWNRDLALISWVTQQVHTQLSAQAALIGVLLPIDMATIFEKLTQVVFDLAAHYEKAEKPGSSEALCDILGRLAEIVYAASGNGSYLYERGVLKL